MSDKAVTARLKRAAQLRRLGLSLQKTKLPSGDSNSRARTPQKESGPPPRQKTK